MQSRRLAPQDPLFPDVDVEHEVWPLLKLKSKAHLAALCLEALQQFWNVSKYYNLVEHSCQTFAEKFWAMSSDYHPFADDRLKSFSTRTTLRRTPISLTN